VIQAPNGSDGLDAVQAERPDLVITDVLMPVMDGYEFVRQLRLDPATSGIPVVFYTAHYGEREARDLALSSGVAFVLTKPASSRTVLAIVGRALSGQSETGNVAEAARPPMGFESAHLRLMTDKLSDKAGDLRTANARLRALINVGLELSSQPDAGRMLEHVCGAAHDLFGATYVTLGILGGQDRTVELFTACGTDAEPWIAIGDSVCGLLQRVVGERRTVRGDNPGGEPASLQLPLRHPEIRAFVAAPIASPAHVYGWICLVRNEGKIFNDDDEQMLLALAGQVGRTYENSCCSQIAQKRTDALEHQIVVRKQAELALRLERDRAQGYLDTADVLLLALDLNGRVTLLNRKGCDLLGWTERDLIGREWIETCSPPRLRDSRHKQFGDVVAGDTSVVEAAVLTRSGLERLVEWHNTVLRDDGGDVVGTLSSGTDITDRNRTADALRIAEERMRFALDAAGVGIWDMDYATGVLRWSETIEAHYGLLPGTFEGTFEAFVERVHPEDRAALVATMANAGRSGEDFSVQHRSVGPDGTVRWLSGAGRIHLGEHGEPIRGVGISLDVTGQRTLEEQYQQAQKMEAIGRLAGGVAHDFNNLLTVILGHCELVLDDLAPDHVCRAGVTEIQKAGESAAGLTRQLLAFSRKQIIEPTLLDLNGVVSGMEAMVARLIREDVKVELVLGSQPTLVNADRGQVEQIVMNLAVNARDAMPAGGTLTIEVTNVELDEHYSKVHLSVKPGLYVVLTVSDTGTGMTPEVQARLFEPFFTSKEPGKGTGLGLATVHGIVARSGGSVNVYSELGRGTSFKVYFPRADAVLPAAETTRPVGRRTGAETVLVVEDAEALRELARGLLERQGYSVLVAADAHEALRVAEPWGSIDVLLTDVVMPGASGPELTRLLVEQRPSLKVIYMSGYTEETIVHHGVVKPGIAFLHKPFTAETLGRKIREVLDR
jgi:PAS domain S-box-containing protein